MYVAYIYQVQDAKKESYLKSSAKRHDHCRRDYQADAWKWNYLYSRSYQNTRELY